MWLCAETLLVVTIISAFLDHLREILHDHLAVSFVFYLNVRYQWDVMLLMTSGYDLKSCCNFCRRVFHHAIVCNANYLAEWLPVWFGVFSFNFVHITIHNSHKTWKHQGNSKNPKFEMTCASWLHHIDHKMSAQSTSQYISQYLTEVKCILHNYYIYKDVSEDTRTQ